MGKVSDRKIVVCAGEGTTGTTTLARFLSKVGLRTMHWSNLSLTLGLSMTHPETYMTSLDWPKLLDLYDAILDQPVPQFFPFIFAAFPNARVLHTVRDPLDWVKQRSKHPDPKPLAGMYAGLASIPSINNQIQKWTNDTAEVGANTTFTKQYYLGLQQHETALERFPEAMLYSAENAFVRCSVPPSQYFGINAFEGDMCTEDFPAKLMKFIGHDLPERFVEGGKVHMEGCEGIDIKPKAEAPALSMKEAPADKVADQQQAMPLQPSPKPEQQAADKPQEQQVASDPTEPDQPVIKHPEDDLAPQPEGLHETPPEGKDAPPEVVHEQQGTGIPQKASQQQATQQPDQPAVYRRTSVDQQQQQQQQGQQQQGDDQVRLLRERLDAADAAAVDEAVAGSEQQQVAEEQSRVTEEQMASQVRELRERLDTANAASDWTPTGVPASGNDDPPGVVSLGAMHGIIGRGR